MSQQKEPSILDYARFHGLAQDYLKFHPFQSLHDPDDFLQQLQDPSGVFCVGDLAVEIPGERMFIDAGTASLLSCIGQPTKSPSRFDEDVGLETKRQQRLRHELPLLRSDHECDIQNFRLPIIPDLENEFLPAENLDEEADEGMTWPTTYLKAPDEIWQKLNTEKPEIPHEALRYLAEILRYDAADTSEGLFEVDEEVELPYKKVRIN